MLHQRSWRDQYGPKHAFTLLSGDSEEPVTITSMNQIRHHLAARAAGLPVSTDSPHSAALPAV